MSSLSFVLASFLALSSTQTPPVPAETPAAEPVTRTLRPRELDLRLTGDTDLLLVYVDVGLGADFGLMELAGGTLSAGAEADLGFCGSACLALSMLTGLRWSESTLAPFARLAYHRALPLKSKTDRLDFYALALVGPVFASMSVEAPDASIKFTGSDVGLGFGAGAGVNYFFSGNFFVGAEGRVRYAQGTYTQTIEVGQYSLSQSEASWDLSGLNVLFFVGARL